MEAYKQQVIKDIKEWIKDNDDTGITLDELRERLDDARYTDAITGNGSGSYYCNAYKAREQVDKSGILWDDDFQDALEDYGTNLGEILKRGPEAVDVWARCVALEQLTDDDLKGILKEINNKGE